MQSTDGRRVYFWLRPQSKIMGMDELSTQLGLAVSNISACLPRPELWSDSAARALAAELESVAAEVGSLIFEIVSQAASSSLEKLGVG